MHGQVMPASCRNTVERMAILSPQDRIPAASVPLEIRLAPPADSRSNLHDTRDSAERESILKALEQTNWNVSGAARMLGIERTNLHKRIRALRHWRAKSRLRSGIRVFVQTSLALAPLARLLLRGTIAAK